MLSVGIVVGGCLCVLCDVHLYIKPGACVELLGYLSRLLGLAKAHEI